MAKLKPVFDALLTLALSCAVGLAARHFSAKNPRLSGTKFPEAIGMAAAGVASGVLMFVVRRRKSAAQVVDGNPGEFDLPETSPLPPGSYEEWRADLEQADGKDGLEKFVRKWSGRKRLPKQVSVVTDASSHRGLDAGCIAPQSVHQARGLDAGCIAPQGPSGGSRIPNVAPASDNVIRYVDDVIKSEKAYDPWPSHRPIKTGLWVRMPTGSLAKIVQRFGNSDSHWEVDSVDGLSPCVHLNNIRPALPKKGEYWKMKDDKVRIFDVDITPDQDMFLHAVYVGDLQPVNFGRGPR